jgi:hypothetical protein
MKYHCMMTCQIPVRHKEALEQLSYQRSAEAGDRITFSDLVREALGQYLKSQKKIAIIKEPEVVND